MESQESASQDEAVVQVGVWEVARGRLGGPGAALDELLAGRQVDLVGDDLRDDMPRDGWRVIHVTQSTGRDGRTELLAAPMPGHEGAFALVSLTDSGGRWDLGCVGGPVPVYPGKAARRRGLRLGWPRVRRARAGQPVRLTVSLWNDSSWQSWHNVADDSGQVVGWLLDGDGQPVRRGPFGPAGYGNRLPCLRPGGRVTLEVQAVHPDPATLPPGPYGLAARLIDLDLRAEPGALILQD